jgi:hypothetical protein
MALVTFKDSQGRGWRAWNVERARLESTQGDYLHERYREGWLVFEPEEGGERRRLTGYPSQWASLPPAELEALRDRAEVAARLGTNGRDVSLRPDTPGEVDRGRSTGR